MIFKLSIAHITGTEKVIENTLYFDKVETQKKSSLFAPYTRKSFILSARHTFPPAALLGAIVLSPSLLIILPAVTAALAMSCAIIGGVQHALGNKQHASFFFEAASFVIREFCQMVVDLIVLPVAALLMIARGVVTGLHAAGILKTSEEQEQSICCPKMV